MFKTILVPIDTSDTSLVAVDYAIELSKSFNSEIVGISIIDVKKLAGPFMRDLGTSIGGMVPYADFQQNVRKFLEDTARAALDEGADMVNDISALRFDPAMAPLVAAEKVPVVLMHMQGTPRTMQQRPHYRDVVEEVKEFLRDQIRYAVQSGVDLERIIIDPGIGFGKELEHNLALLRALPALADLGRPVLVGPSRKTFIGKILDVGPEERLEGSLAAAVAAVLGGASVIRTHDVKEARRAIRVADAMRFGGARSEGAKDV